MSDVIEWREFETDPPAEDGRYLIGWRSTQKPVVAYCRLEDGKRTWLDLHSSPPHQYVKPRWWAPLPDLPAEPVLVPPDRLDRLTAIEVAARALLEASRPCPEHGDRAFVFGPQVRRLREALS